MLTAEQIASYHENGYILVENAIPADRLAELQTITRDFIDKSRSVTESNEVFDLDEGHGPNSPRLTRIKLPHKQHPLYWDTLVNGRIAEALRDLLGPDVLLSTAKLNTKAPGGGAAVEWHQDWAFYPHTNDDLLAVGLMLDDVDEANGPLQVVPGSHKGPVLSHHNADGVFCGAVDPEDPAFDKDKIVTLTGKAGDMTIHHVRTLHGSAPNMSDRNRLILFYECLAADAWPLGGGASYIHRLEGEERWRDLNERVICGAPSITPRVVPCPIRMPLPPAPDAGSIFKTQKTGGARSAFKMAG